MPDPQQQAIKAIETLIGYTFKDSALLSLAITHASTASGQSYERLEFLGDRVLGMAVANTLYEKFANEPEGDLAKRLSALVQGETLAQIAREHDLGQYIQMSEAERNAGGADNDHILADIVEAILGALYLDAGYETCQKLVAQLWGDRFYEMTRPPLHPKTRVQEWSQAKGIGLPVYEIIDQSGPDHAPVFEVCLTVGDYKPACATGKSRQEAEKKAAHLFMKDKS